MALTEPIRNETQVRAMLSYYRNKGQPRNQVLLALSVHTALRVSDILALKNADAYDFSRRRVRKSITVAEKKTGKKKIIALNKTAIKALEAYFAQFPKAAQDEPLIINGQTRNAISRVQAYRLISEAAKAVGIEQKVGCHSLRKTFGYHAWRGGVSPVLLMEIYNHSSYAVTKRYLGVTQDEQNAVYENLRF